jgi:ADP-ribosylation factor GTPase-activating protein 2/3
VRKLESKVDESVFDQAPAPEPVKAAAVDPLPLSAQGSVSSPSAVSAAAGSRFSYDTLTQVEWGGGERDRN